MENLTTSYQGIEITSSDVRNDIGITVPKIFQPFFTWLTGIPLLKEGPLFLKTGIYHLITTYALLFLSMYGSYLSFIYCPWLLPICWLLTVNAARKLITTINHYAVHKDLMPAWLTKRFPDIQIWIAEVNSSVLILQDYLTYFYEHVIVHHYIYNTATVSDPDMEFLSSLGFKPGLSKSKLWRNLIYNAVFPFSPLHRNFFTSRLKTLVFHGNALRNSVTMVVVALLLLIALKSSFWVVFVIYIFPLTYLYHISALLQFSSEHIWLYGTDPNGNINSCATKAEVIDRSKKITVARCPGCAVPKATGSRMNTYLAWLFWTLKIVFVHLPIRLFVLPGDLIQHDWHHRGQYRDNWMNAVYARATFKSKLAAGQPPMVEVYGLFTVIGYVFENLSKMPSFSEANTHIDHSAIFGM